MNMDIVLFIVFHEEDATKPLIHIDWEELLQDMIGTLKACWYQSVESRSHGELDRSVGRSIKTIL